MLRGRISPSAWTDDNIYIERLRRSVKHEDVYQHGYANMGELLIGLAKYFDFYNQERLQQGLGNQTLAAVYASGQGGTALIVDKYGSFQAKPPSPAVDKARAPKSLALSGDSSCGERAFTTAAG